MKVFVQLIMIVVLCISCNSTNNVENIAISQNNDSVNVEFSKIAQLQLPFPEDMHDSIASIYNMDYSVFANFEYDTASEEMRCEALKGNVVAYYPSWNMMNFFYEDYDSIYGKIRVGENWKLIKKELIYNVHELNSFLCSLEFWPEPTDLFFQDDFNTKIDVPNASILKCKIKAVKGDWIQVQDGDFKAWTKWKNSSIVYADRLRYEI